MDLFTAAVKWVIVKEGNGKVTKDPNDPGGTTKYGISQRSYPSLDIENLTEDQAIEIYHTDFWQKGNCDYIPAPLAVMLFDATVNQGFSAGAHMFQTAIGVHADGIIGRLTVEAANKADVPAALDELAARRMVAYGLDSLFTREGLGWSRRLIDAFQFALGFSEGK